MKIGITIKKLVDKLITFGFQIPMLATILLLIFFFTPNYTNSLWTIITFLNLFFLTMLYGIYAYKNKKISDENILIRKERILPFFIITLIYGINFFLTLSLSAPPVFKFIATNYFLLAFIVSVITIFWKISVHVAGITNFVLFLMIFFTYKAIIFSPLAILVWWVRVKAKYHTPRQTFAGMLAGIVAIYLTSLFGY